MVNIIVPSLWIIDKIEAIWYFNLILVVSHTYVYEYSFRKYYFQCQDTFIFEFDDNIFNTYGISESHVNNRRMEYFFSYYQYI